MEAPYTKCGADSKISIKKGRVRSLNLLGLAFLMARHTQRSQEKNKFLIERWILSKPLMVEERIEFLEKHGGVVKDVFDLDGEIESAVEEIKNMLKLKASRKLDLLVLDYFSLSQSKK